MRRSTFLFGREVDAEPALSEWVGGDIRRFMSLAQRIAWPLMAPDIFLRVDVFRAARELVAGFGGAFPAHLFDAWAWRARDPERADAALARAAQLATPDHPLHYLLPLEREWAAELPNQVLAEVVPNRIWRVAHGFPLPTSPLPISSTATVIRSDGGELAILNPVAIEEAVARQLEALGKVRWVISQSRAHHAYLNQVQKRFPGSLAIGTEGHLKHLAAAHVELDAVLGTYQGLPRELELLPVQGHVLEEVAVLHRPTQTLIVQDFVGAAGPDCGMSFATRLYAFAFGATERTAMASYAPLLWLDTHALRGSLRAIADSGFERLLAAHWPLEPSTGAELTPFRTALDFSCGFGKFDHRMYLARFFFRQPTFLLDLARYDRKTRNARGARLRTSSAAS